MSKRFQYEFTHHTVGLAKIYIEGGMYSIAELEQKLADFKRVSAAMTKQLERSMQQTKKALK
jgi:hypothetical protein